MFTQYFQQQWNLETYNFVSNKIEFYRIFLNYLNVLKFKKIKNMLSIVNYFVFVLLSNIAEY